ncbi:hypothetical protein NDU88_011394 [Pleurodeles waltl]|uniref:Uncharacterized protein n=1 Tax=Pleurodeles waltl TaxID=8319 RepID=A0AAV7PYJ8_PLEWA|nr:hypothetical protein NDU88_011394 [Pleurodeles waltl]
MPPAHRRSPAHTSGCSSQSRPASSAKPAPVVRKWPGPGAPRRPRIDDDSFLSETAVRPLPVIVGNGRMVAAGVSHGWRPCVLRASLWSRDALQALSSQYLPVSLPCCPSLGCLMAGGPVSSECPCSRGMLSRRSHLSPLSGRCLSPAAPHWGVSWPEALCPQPPCGRGSGLSHGWGACVLPWGWVKGAHRFTLSREALLKTTLSPTNQELQEKRQSHLELQQKRQSHLELQQKRQAHLELQQKRQSHLELQEKRQAHQELRAKRQAHLELQQKRQTHLELQEKRQAHLELQEKRQAHLELQQKRASTPRTAREETNTPRTTGEETSTPRTAGKETSTPRTTAEESKHT